MLPYQEDGKKLETLLGRLFEDDDELTPEGVLIVKKPGGRKPRGSCCSYNYTNY